MQWIVCFTSQTWATLEPNDDILLNMNNISYYMTYIYTKTREHAYICPVHFSDTFQDVEKRFPSLSQEEGRRLKELRTIEMISNGSMHIGLGRSTCPIGSAAAPLCLKLPTRISFVSSCPNRFHKPPWIGWTKTKRTKFEILTASSSKSQFCYQATWWYERGFVIW